MATTDVLTEQAETNIIPVKLAANQVVPAGTMVAVNSGTGYGVSANDSVASCTVQGVAIEAADATGKADGEVMVLVRRNRMFKFKNSSTAACGQTELFESVFSEDNETVSKTTTESNIAGKLMQIDTDGVWVQIPG